MGRPVAIPLFVLSALLLVGCYDSFDNTAKESQSALPLVNSTIEQLHAIYSSGVRTIDQDIVVEGTVVANDQNGNLFKSFVIQSGDYSLEILDGLYDSYVRHPLGATLRVRLEGLGLDRYLGVLRTGLVAPPTSHYTLDYMGSEAIVNRQLVVVGLGSELEPATMRYEELSERDAGRLICVEGVRLHTDDGVERTWSGYSLFRTAERDSIWCYTSPYADFAAAKIPQCEVSICGVLQFGATSRHADQFIIKMRSESDCLY